MHMISLPAIEPMIRILILQRLSSTIRYQAYLNIQEDEDDGLFIQDILRGGITNDDPRIPRNVPS